MASPTTARIERTPTHNDLEITDLAHPKEPGVSVITDIAPKVDRRSPLDKAIHYWTPQQPTLRAFLDDGRSPMLRPCFHAPVQRMSPSCVN